MQKAYSIRLRDRGQLTLPKSIRQELDIAQGDMLNLVQIGDVFVLSPRQQLLSGLADEFTTIMEEEDVSLADLLQGLEEERRAIWRKEQDAHA